MKKAVSAVRWAIVFPLLTSSATPGCAVHLAALPPAVPVVPVSFEANLVTAQQCEYRGIADSQEQARTEGANLVLAFTYNDASSASGMNGKAVSCPQEALNKILAMGQSGNGSVQ
jgi:hypothetical protein